MSVFRHVFAPIALIGLVILTPGFVRAQNPPLPAQPGLGGQQMGTLSNPYATTNTYPVVGSMSNQGGMSYPYFPPFFNPYLFPGLDPVTGYMFGAASITQANAQYQLTIQQARLQSQYANQAAYDTRRKLFDQIRYERSFMPSAEDIRIQEMTVALNRSRRNPPLVEIWSGDSLNSLLAHLIKQQGAGVPGPQVPLDDGILERINVTGGTGGNIGLLKDLARPGARLHWPVPMQRAEYEREKDILNQLLPEAVREVQDRRPLQGNVIKSIQDAMQRLSDRVDQAAVNDLTASDYFESRRYINQLRAGFRALTDPDAANFFNRTWAARGKTVQELVSYMSNNGLRFAAATQGDQPAYTALHSKLVSYDDGISRNMLATPR